MDVDLTYPTSTAVGCEMCKEGNIDVEGDYEYLKPHGARRGIGEALYRQKGHSAAQRALRHADPSTTSETYPYIEASEQADEASDAFENIDRQLNTQVHEILILLDQRIYEADVNSEGWDTAL